MRDHDRLTAISNSSPDNELTPGVDHFPLQSPPLTISDGHPPEIITDQLIRNQVGYGPSEGNPFLELYKVSGR